LYVAGHNLFRLRVVGKLSTARTVCVFVLLVVGTVAGRRSAFDAEGSIFAVLFVLTLWESVRIRRYYFGHPPHDRPASLRHLGRYLDD
jgi:hypothetical protein